MVMPHGPGEAAWGGAGGWRRWRPLRGAHVRAARPPQAHLGTKNCTASMERYVYRRRNDGIFVFNLAKTWEKLQLAARIIVAIENPQDIVAISARPYGQRAVLKFAHYTGAKSTVGRHTPGARPLLLTCMLLLPRGAALAAAARCRRCRQAHGALGVSPWSSWRRRARMAAARAAAACSVAQGGMERWGGLLAHVWDGAAGWSGARRWWHVERVCCSG